jgi:transcriptional regulator with XRE-family HTH domain
VHESRLGSAIRLIRQRRRWTQQELGARAGVSKSTISRIERGHLRTLSVATI